MHHSTAAAKHTDGKRHDLTKKEAMGEHIDTIFGPITVHENSLLVFPAGILGFEEVHHFTISDAPKNKFKGIFLLQPLPPISHSFLIMPLQKQNGLLQKAHLEQACDLLTFHFDALDVYGIITPHMTDQNITMNINLQAPILIDQKRKIGCQYIFEDAVYPTKCEMIKFPRKRNT